MAGELIISRIDRDRLNKLIEDALYGGRQPDPSYRALQREIERARVVEPQALPANVLTMRSRALIALDGEEEEAQLVYPDEADWTRGRLSVLSPVARRCSATARATKSSGRWPAAAPPSRSAGSSTSPRRRGIITCNARAHAAERDLHARRSSDAEQHPRTYHQTARWAPGSGPGPTPPAHAV